MRAANVSALLGPADDKSRPGGCRGGGSCVTLSSYLAMRYIRSPAGFFEDSIVSPPLLPRMETKPRTVCGCQPVTSMISASVTPLARFIIAVTSAFLLERSPLSALFLAGAAFTGAAFLAALDFFAGFNT